MRPGACWFLCIWIFRHWLRKEARRHGWVERDLHRHANRHPAGRIRGASPCRISLTVVREKGPRDAYDVRGTTRQRAGKRTPAGCDCRCGLRGPAGAAASLGVHGSATVAARNLEPCFVVERNMRQHQPWCSESPTSDILASRIVADQSGRRRPPSYGRPRGTGSLSEQR